MTSVTHEGETFHFEWHTYPGGARCLVLIDPETGETFAKITTNLPDQKIKPDEIIVKTWGENVSICKTLLASGLFFDTGVRFKTGYVEAQLWRVVAAPK